MYVAGRKLASIGLRVRRGCSYHGLALNVDMDLEPFRRINPCGMAGLAMTQLVAEGARTDVAAAATRARAARGARRSGSNGTDASAARRPLRSAQSATSTTPLSVRSW